MPALLANQDTSLFGDVAGAIQRAVKYIKPIVTSLSDATTQTAQSWANVPQQTLQAIQGKPITPNPELAKSYGENVVSKKVRLGDVLDSKSEPGLGEESIYRPQSSVVEPTIADTPVQQALAQLKQK